MTSILVGIDDKKAIYKGEDVTGQKFGQYTVIERLGVRRYPSGNTHHIWLVECDCGTKVETQAQKVINAKFGCSNCNGKNIRGKNSAHWMGGDYVPAYFVSKVKSKLVRPGRTIDFRLTIEELDDLWVKQGGSCAYTKLPLSFGDNASECTASLDRIDSSGIYEKENVQFVHKVINIMKWNLSDSEFRNYCRMVVENG